MTIGSHNVCEEHFEAVLEHIKICLHPDRNVRYREVTKADESVECGYPECTKEATYRVLWTKAK